MGGVAGNTDHNTNLLVFYWNRQFAVQWRCKVELHSILYICTDAKPDVKCVNADKIVQKNLPHCLGVVLPCVDQMLFRSEHVH